jgi:hypothetical protein
MSVFGKTDKIVRNMAIETPRQVRKRIWTLPPLILHPFADSSGPGRLVERLAPERGYMEVIDECLLALGAMISHGILHIFDTSQCLEGLASM